MVNMPRAIAVVGVAMALSLGSTSVAAADTSGDNLSSLVSLNPGSDRISLRASVELYAQSNRLSYDQALTTALAEARTSAAAASSPSQSRGDARSASSGGGGGGRLLGAPRQKGDIFVSPATTAFVHHGHTGVFYSATTVVEAPGQGKVSRSITVAGYEVGPGAVKQQVNVSTSARSASANYAYNSLRDKPYNSNFAFNRNENGNLNCSQLVWLAFLRGAGIDIDGNGGAGVYPYDIKGSPYAQTYATL